MSTLIAPARVVVDGEVVLGRLSSGGEHAAHIVKVPHGHPAPTPQAYILAARVFCLEVEALCGYVWVPSRDPAPLPVCALCQAMYEALVREDDRDDLPDA